MSTGTTSSQAFTSGSGNFSVPAGVSSVLVSMIGGGGAGLAKIAGAAGGGGGSGEFCLRVSLSVTPGGTVAYSVGTGGVGTTQTNPGPNGTATTFGPLVVQGGFGCPLANTDGNGGGGRGGAGGNGSAGAANSGGNAPSTSYGAGGGGSSTGSGSPVGGSGAGGYILVTWVA